MKKEYTAVIRTLGKAGDKYQATLDSLCSQTIQPANIIVYLAEGYDFPVETCGREKIVRVRKGMVAQRALPYDEVTTDYMLFLDDDVFLPPDAVDRLFDELDEANADVVAPCVFANHKASLKHKIAAMLTFREIPLLNSRKWGYRVLPSAGFAFNNNPKGRFLLSETNAGPCFLCSKKDFANIRFEDDLWLDEASYAFPEDQVMFYKMSLAGLRQITSYDSGIIHLDAGSSVSDSSQRIYKIIQSEYRNKLIFWYKYIYQSRKHIARRIAVLAIGYAYAIQGIKFAMLSILGNSQKWNAYKSGVSSAIDYIRKNGK